jgi:hypothetical protein
MPTLARSLQAALALLAFGACHGERTQRMSPADASVPVVADAAVSSADASDPHEFDGASMDPTDAGARFVPVRVAAGGGRSCVLGQLGELYCWGLKRHDLDSVEIDFTPRLISVTSPLTLVATGASYTCAAQASGLMAWGVEIFVVGLPGSSHDPDDPMAIDESGVWSALAVGSSLYAMASCIAGERTASVSLATVTTSCLWKSRVSSMEKIGPRSPRLTIIPAPFARVSFTAGVRMRADSSAPVTRMLALPRRRSEPRATGPRWRSAPSTRAAFAATVCFVGAATARGKLALLRTWRWSPLL